MKTHHDLGHEDRWHSYGFKIFPDFLDGSNSAGAVWTGSGGPGRCTAFAEHLSEARSVPDRQKGITRRKCDLDLGMECGFVITSSPSKGAEGAFALSAEGLERHEVERAISGFHKVAVFRTRREAEKSLALLVGANLQALEAHLEVQPALAVARCALMHGWTQGQNGFEIPDPVFWKLLFEAAGPKQADAAAETE